MKSYSALILLLTIYCSISMGENRFGTTGNTGHQGQDGRNGDNGQPLNIYADGKPGFFRALGEDGENSYDGRDGFDAMNCVQPQKSTSNLIGADGGRGGSGGTGGKGGNGGTLTVHYSEISNLKKISIQASPGQGGRGSYGGNGGRPCHCSQGSWTVGEGAEMKTYFCNNGDYGDRGYTGKSGSNGTYGQVTLIGQLEELLPTNKSVSFKMENMENISYQVSSNLWANKTGARNLFAAGSYLSDSYYYWVGRKQIDYKFHWAAKRPLTDFSGHQITLDLNQNSVSKYFPSDLWYEGNDVEVDPTHREYTFHAAALSKEVAKLKFASVTGTGAGLTAEITDDAKISDTIKSELTFEYFTRSGNTYYRRYSKKLAPEFVTARADGLTAALSTSEINPNYTKPATQTLIRIYVKRSLGGKSVTYYYDLRYTLPQ